MITSDGQLKFDEEIIREQKTKDVEKPDRFIFTDTELAWGTKILSDHDPAWSDPEYLQKLREFASPAITGYGGKAAQLWIEYQKYFNNFFKGEIQQVMSSGTDANNSLFLWAHSLFEHRHGRKPVNLKLISFDDVYGGSYGQITTDRHQIKNNPAFEPGKILKGQELLEQIKLEDEALRNIESAILDPTFDVGAIFLEPMPAAQGIKIYRTEFIKKLSELAEKHKVPIFCDEILTGGGRTGKFWAFQHYQNNQFRFVPDLVTFGKGLAVSGVFKPDPFADIHLDSDVLDKKVEHSFRGFKATYKLKNNREAEYIYDGNIRKIIYRENGVVITELSVRELLPRLETRFETTTRMNSLALLQSLQILKTIWNRRLDLNAAKSGQHLNMRIQQARQFALKNHRDRLAIMNPVATGVGLIFRDFNDLKRSLGAQNNPEVGYRGRLLMHLDTTKEDIDWLLSEKWGLRFDSETK